jgi:hypothetical protein
MPTLHSVTDADAYDVAAASLGRMKTTTLAECVPLLDIALEFIDRGPAELTIEAVESYREKAIRILENMRPVIERQAKTTLSDWMHRVGANEVELRVAA